jgi:hypothetical protein
VKLAIRHDNEADLVRAYFSKLDDSERFEIATISLSLLRAVPELFEKWKEALNLALVFTMKEMGHDVIGVHEIRPHDKN